MVALGVLLGAGAEACVLAMSLSQPKSLFKMSTRFHQRNPDQLHDMCAVAMSGSYKVDNGTYSEPIMYLQVRQAYIRTYVHTYIRTYLSHAHMILLRWLYLYVCISLCLYISMSVYLYVSILDGWYKH